MGSNPHIIEDYIFLYSNTTQLTNVDSSMASVEIDSIIPSTNQTINSPITGVLYDRGLSCVADPPEALPGLPSTYNQDKIALIQAGNCSFLSKVLLAQNDSALAAIIFINGKFDADTSSLMDIPPVGQSGVNIPTYLVQGQDGMNMYNTLKTYEHSNASIGNNITKSRALRVTMYPASGAFPSAWEFTLIIVVALLAVSFILSVFLHWHLWRVRRRQRIMLENNIALGPTVASTIPQNKTVIDPSQLELFPARIIGEEDESELPVPETIPTEEEKQLSRRSSMQSIRSNKSTRSSHALQNAEALATCSQGDLPLVAQVLIKHAENAESETTEAEITDKADAVEGEANDEEKQATATPGQEVLSATNIAQSQSDATCVICLDEFDIGEKVRQLPCRHEFHCECIDPWLTIKSASCPLCKMDCSLSIPRTAANESTQQAPQPPPPAASSGSRFQSFFSMSPSTSPSSFGPTITADNAANFSNSWMARSLPRNMRRQLEAASAAMNGPTIELPARMTGNPQHPQPQDLEANNPTSSQGTLPNRMARSLPRYWRSRE